MQLKRVTITGADDGTPISEIINLSAEFPFVEWGILISQSQTREHTVPAYNPRWPSIAWMNQLYHHLETSRQKMNLSLHLCEGGLRRLVATGDRSIFNLSALWRFAERVQFNFHGETQEVNPPLFIDALKLDGAKQYIFQMDSNVANEQMCAWASCILQLDVSPFFDCSHGAGVLPASWPWPTFKAGWYGYAGGLGPDNVERELARISLAAGSNDFWIDMETRVRTDDQRMLDLEKVREVLKICAPYVHSNKSQFPHGSGAAKSPGPGQVGSDSGTSSEDNQGSAENQPEGEIHLR